MMGDMDVTVSTTVVVTVCTNLHVTNRLVSVTKTVTRDILMVTVYLFFLLFNLLKLKHTFTECDEGTYGYNCSNNCSDHCLNNSPCNKQTGHCDKGCNPGYTDSYCRKCKRLQFDFIEKRFFFHFYCRTSKLYLHSN